MDLLGGKGGGSSIQRRKITGDFSIIELTDSEGHCGFVITFLRFEEKVGEIIEQLRKKDPEEYNTDDLYTDLYKTDTPTFSYNHEKVYFKPISSFFVAIFGYRWTQANDRCN